MTVGTYGMLLDNSRPSGVAGAIRAAAGFDVRMDENVLVEISSTELPLAVRADDLFFIFVATDIGKFQGRFWRRCGSGYAWTFYCWCCIELFRADSRTLWF